MCTGTLKGYFVCKDKSIVNCFILEDNVVNAIVGKSLECCYHGKLDITHMTPDLASACTFTVTAYMALNS